jgi:hypothetical protein
MVNARKPFKPKPTRPLIVAHGVVAEWLTISRQRVDQLVREGHLKRIKKDQYNLAECVQGYIKFLREDQRRYTIHAADSRVRDARARELEVRTQQRLYHLVPASLYNEMISYIVGVVRSEFAGLAAAATRDLDMRRLIDREVNERFKRIGQAALAEATRIEADRVADNAVGSVGTPLVGGGESDVPTNGSGAGSA